ncbi:hypothetical protein AVEN_130047-1 [Araneus ventricosus]|uniref:Uncharacterized protein n=1 Tax=Araneus ventricosus TaxID=182803 RepID=A0A4Y2M1I0_ARAVE|nr:hypothetical protein AVEN_130047-1 [Araneus ventricosus]
MEKQLRYVLMLSLEEMALRRVAVVLWNEPDILASIGKLQFKPDRNPFHPAWDEIEWRGTVECKVTDEMSKLLLPESLKKQMIPRLKAVGLEIPIWKVLHEAYLSDSNEDFNIDILEKLFWTTVGTVDYKKTAEELVRCDEVDIVKRFELACFYCLENYIPLFWNELPEENKKTFYNEEDTSRVERPNLQLFLPYILKRQPEFDHLPLTTIHTNSFEYSALCGNKTLTEYCFWKLSKEEREASLVQTAINLVIHREDMFFRQSAVRQKKLSDVLCYLLSLMTPEEQIRIFKELSCEVLRCFLDWPWQDLFWDIADVSWTFLPERKYRKLLFKIKVSIGDSGCCFPTFFQNLFLRSPIDFIKRFVDHECRDGDFSGYF